MAERERKAWKRAEASFGALAGSFLLLLIRAAATDSTSYVYFVTGG